MTSGQNKKSLGIVGISGRMGAELSALAGEFGFEVAAGVSSKPSGANRVSKVADLDPALCDVVIDFSLPELTPDVIAYCVKNRKPLVSGVTGISSSDKAAIEKAGQTIPILWSPNMSLGVAVMARMFQALAQLEGFDFQIEELHHNRKKDRPSGTALFLQEKLASAVKKPLPEPVAIRGGGIFGIHRAWAMGEEETITIEHTAMNRRVFARGALKAASWLKTKPPGVYRMDDVLGT